MQAACQFGKLQAYLFTAWTELDSTVIGKIELGISVLFNLLLVFWLLFLPK
jgi:hypothetical protein